MQKGIFISLEGGEGVGKTTQLNFIKQWFESHDLPYIITHEPGGTPLGEEIRQILKYSKYQILPRAELLLFNAARAELIEEVIKPSINNRINVIADRFFDSSIVYQSYGRGLELNDVVDICMYATSQIEPDLTFWLDLSPKEAFERKFGPDAGDRFEHTGLEFHNKVYEGYKKLAKQYHRIKVIDASKSEKEVSEQIDYYLTQKFLLNKEI